MYEGVYRAYLGQIEARVVVDRVAVLDNNKVCMYLLVVFLVPSILEVFEVVHTEPESS